MKQTVHLKIIGTVQGVFFRQSTIEKARELDLTGWVRNCEDGSVEIEAEGDERLLKAFVQWCHRGPRNAVVKNVEINNIEAKNFSAFEIKR